VVAVNCPLCGYEHYVNKAQPGKDFCDACCNQVYKMHIPLTDVDAWESGIARVVIIRQMRVVDYENE